MNSEKVKEIKGETEMIKQHQIEEIAKVIGNTWLVDLEGDTKDVCEVLDEIDIKGIARELYEQGYRKLPEDSVVLTKKEYEQLKQTIISQSEESTKLCTHLTQKIIDTRKETAEKIFTELLKEKELIDLGCGDGTYEYIAVDDLKDLAKQYSIEIKE